MRASDQRGVVFPSPIVILSVIAVAMAAFAFVATRGSGTDEREITPSARDTTPSASASTTTVPKPEKTKKPKPAVQRSKIYVEVYNNSSISGLAGRVGQQASDAGWQVVGADNWYGTIPATTVYFPPSLKREGKQLALDLGVERTAPAVAPMKMDRLTVILTGELG